MKIQRQITLFFLPFTIIPGLVIVAMIYTLSFEVLNQAVDRMVQMQELSRKMGAFQEDLKVELTEELQQEHQAKLDQLRLVLESHSMGLENLLESMISQPGTAIFVEQESMREIGLKRTLLNAFTAAIRSYKLGEIVFVDPVGKEIIRQAREVTPPGGDPLFDSEVLKNFSQDESKSSWFLARQSEVDQLFSHTIVQSQDFSDRRFMLCISTSLRYLSGSYSRKFGENMGVATLNVPLDETFKQLIEMIGFSDQLTVTDQRNRILFSNTNEKLGETLTLKNEKDSEYIYSSAECLDKKLCLHIRTSMESVSQRLKELNQIKENFSSQSSQLQTTVDEISRLPLRFLFLVLLIGFGTTLICVLAVVWMARRIATPIQRLDEAAYEVSKGNLNSQLPRGFADELDALSSSFDDMRKQLGQRIEDLKKAKVQAEAATQAKGEFLANMSHELRTPLNGVIGGAELLRSTTMDRQQIELLNTLQMSAEGTLALINDILDLSKIEAGEMRLEMIPVDLRLLMSEVMGVLSHLAEEKDIDLHGIVDHRLPSEIKTDPLRLKQILINLMGNAIKFTSKGEVVVEMILLKEDGDKVTLEIKVKDSGIGIPKDQQEKLFQNFVQVDASTTRKFGGSGLGLAISQHFVSMLGSKIEIESRENKGSSFSFRFEADALPLPPKNTKNRSDSQEAQWIAVIGRKSILKKELEELIIHEGYKPKFYDDLASYFGEGSEDLFAPYVIWIPEQDKNLQSEVLLISKSKKTSENWILLGKFSLLQTLPKSESSNFSHILSLPLIGKSFLDVLQGNVTSGLGLSVEGHPRFSGMVLLVEDNTTNQKIEGKILEKLGVDVVLAENGQVALDSLKTIQPDLVFMDCQMPVMDGYEATQLIRKWEKEESQLRPLPIIALTANVMKEDINRCLETGMDDVISKPIKTTEIVRILEKWLN